MITEHQFRQMQARTAPAKAVPIGPGVDKEADLQDDIELWCRKNGWWAIRSRMDRPTTNGAGTPDFIILADGGRTFYIECKSKTGKVKPDQRIMHAVANKLGHTVHTVRNLNEFLYAIGHRPTET